LRTIQYNVLDGGHDHDRFRQIGEWLSRQSCNVAGFNELNGWSGEQLAEQAAVWGHSHCFVYEKQTSPYRIGITADSPIEWLGNVDTGFEHGLLHVRIGGIHYLITHLSSADSTKREQEAAMITQWVEGIDEPLVVMGDLNTLSPYDHSVYEQGGLYHSLIDNEKLARKFIKNGSFNYNPMHILLGAGLADTGCTGGFEHSVPTAFNQDAMHAAKLRLDYILVNDTLMKRGAKSRIIRDAEVDGLSDHYPILCEWSS